MDIMFLMNFIIIFTLFLASGVLIIIFYQIIKIDFKKLREITKESNSKEVLKKESLNEKLENEKLEENQKSDNKSMKINYNQVDSINQVVEKQTTPELSKVEDVETLLKGASKNQEEVNKKEELTSLTKDVMEIKNNNVEIKVDQSDKKQLSKSIEIEKGESEQLSEVESLLKVEEIKPSDLNKQFMELSEYVKKLRDSLKALRKNEEI
ncbi:MAG: hypothetical protein QXW62_00660 [Candidatus Methanomethylicaceae archaeon]|nr:hypothetical protein [Candidatus Verstraetearchaeota archaeon]